MSTVSPKEYEKRETALVGEYISALKAELSKQQDNPDIQKLSHSVYIINSSRLADCWDAFFHDWSAQYKLIIEKLEACKHIGEANRFLARIVECYSPRTKNSRVKIGRETKLFSGAVVETLQNILGK